MKLKQGYAETIDNTYKIHKNVLMENFAACSNNSQTQECVYGNRVMTVPKSDLAAQMETCSLIRVYRTSGVISLFGRKGCLSHYMRSTVQSKQYY